MDDIYAWLQRDGLWLWRAIWRTDDSTWFVNLVARILYPFFRGSIGRIYADERPDLVLSVHSMVNHIPLRVLRRQVGSHVPFVTMVTDMVTVHPSWCCPEVDYCMVPTEEARQAAIRFGMRAESLEVVGQPVSLSFASRIGAKSEVRARLALDPVRPCVLVVGGGDGVGPIYETTRAIANQVPGAQMVIVAGHNSSLKRRLEGVAWEIPTTVCGFVDNMPELMSASDLLVTKAGPGTLAEAWIAGLPVIISNFTPGQETANVQYVVDHNAGSYASEPDEIARIVREWLQPGNTELQRVVANAAALARPDASTVIAQRLYSMLRPGPAVGAGPDDLQTMEASLSR
jgi:1,2-diacylglycerol 3-beta-galactosyltransferase